MARRRAGGGVGSRMGSRTLSSLDSLEHIAGPSAACDSVSVAARQAHAHASPPAAPAESAPVARCAAASSDAEAVSGAAPAAAALQSVSSASADTAAAPASTAWLAAASITSAPAATAATGVQSSTAGAVAAATAAVGAAAGAARDSMSSSSDGTGSRQQYLSWSDFARVELNLAPRAAAEHGSTGAASGALGGGGGGGGLATPVGIAAAHASRALADRPPLRDVIWNNVSVPLELEQFLLFGCVVCLDSLLFAFTVLPLRCVAALLSCGRRAGLALFRTRTRGLLRKSQMCDVIRVFLVLVGVVALSFIDSARIFHYVRGQAVLKLYVIFNVIEILDRLLASFGIDALEALYETASNKRMPRRALVVDTLLASAYVAVHAFVMLLQMVTLNVAIHSSNALLTLLISNQFVELKGAVFKRFEAGNLLQCACADIVERFQMLVYLCVVTLQHLAALEWHLSTEWALDWLLMVGWVWVSEMVVDSIKHVFVCKFNNHRSSMYRVFRLVLCGDLLVVSRPQQNFLDRSHWINRRIGFISLPLAALVIRHVSVLFSLSVGGLLAIGAAAVACLFALKAVISVALLGFACKERARVPEFDNYAREFASVERYRLCHGRIC